MGEFLIESMIRFIGQTVTIFTTSGGLSGNGFTGVLAGICDGNVKLITEGADIIEPEVGGWKLEKRFIDRQAQVCYGFSKSTYILTGGSLCILHRCWNL